MATVAAMRNLAGRTFYWKIDYYDERCEYGSLDPADPEKTTRVLTLMLGEDHITKN